VISLAMIILFSAHKKYLLRNTKKHEEGKFQKRDVSRVTCLSKPITQQFKDNNSSIEIDNNKLTKRTHRLRKGGKNADLIGKESL
jgi:hypothetical protein